MYNYSTSLTDGYTGCPTKPGECLECLAMGHFFIILFDIKQLNKSWNKTFKTVNQLSCFAGHHVEEKKETERKLVKSDLPP